LFEYLSDMAAASGIVKLAFDSDGVWNVRNDTTLTTAPCAISCPEGIRKKLDCCTVVSQYTEVLQAQ
jgi:hypothetical protein